VGDAVKRFVLGSVALFAVGASIPAHSADMALKAPPLPAPPAPYNWSGLYLGANIGGAFSSGTANLAGTTWDPGATEFIGGFQVGYNWQFGHFLVGVEGNFDWAIFGGPVQASANQNWISTVAGRFGITSDKWLYYGKFGGGWAEDRASVSFPNGTSWSGSSTIGGWVAGGGIEYAFKPNWTIKLEYDYLGLGNWTTSTVPPVSWNRDIQMITMGVNYKFGSGAPSGLRRSWTRKISRHRGGPRKASQGRTEPHCRPDQRAVPEQHQLQRWTVQPRAERPQHPASGPLAFERRLDRHFAHHRTTYEPA
jgi:opacity protein-like surface antigen